MSKSNSQRMLIVLIPPEHITGPRESERCDVFTESDRAQDRVLGEGDVDLTRPRRRGQRVRRGAGLGQDVAALLSQDDGVEEVTFAVEAIRKRHHVTSPGRSRSS